MNAIEGKTRRGCSRFVALALLLLFVLPQGWLSGQELPLTGLDGYIRNAMQEWGIAGLAIAVVHDDSVVFAQGYGVREVGKPDPVDTHTLFAIGSNTKFFTAVALGTLVDQGKMDWDAPVTTYLPWFQLYDPYVTREFTVGDALSHDSGLGRRGDLLWYGSAYNRDEVLRRIRYLKPISSFRAKFGYQNIMVMAAGQAGGAAAGESWDSLVTGRILRPLGMAQTNTSVRDLAGLPDVAQPHVWHEGKPTPVPWRNIDNIGPAGSINSNVMDMSHWLRMLLDDGRVGGEQIIKPATLQRIEAPHTVMPFSQDSLFPSIHFVFYGYGIGMNDYHGVKVLQHTGGIDGMLSQVALIPEKHLGLVVLTNTEGHNALFTALMWRVFDAYLGASPRDWSTILLERTKKQEAAAAARWKKRQEERKTGTHPSLSLSAYAGTYRNEMYGDLDVQFDGKKLVVHFGPSFTGDLTHWHYDTFLANWRSIREGRAFLNFHLGIDGKVDSVEVQGIASFARVAEQAEQKDTGGR